MNRPDFSNYVAHFTKDSDPLGKADHAEEESFNVTKGSAYDRLLSILASKHILATPMPWTGSRAVAFTECPFWSLLDHATRYSPYGIGFTKPHLFASGGGPAVYLRPDLFGRQMDFCHKDRPDWIGFDKQLYSFVTPFMPPYAPQDQIQAWKKPLVDYTHEREWRVPHDFSFRLDQVQFVILRSYEDMARFPREHKDDIGRDKFIILDIYKQIESLWPTHQI